MKYIQPEVLSNSFTCPHCGVIAKQDWWYRNWNASRQGDLKNNPLRVGTCQHCNKSSVWIDEKMYYPNIGNAPSPNPDLPDDIREDYNEARNIIELSPRGAVALLRLTIQKLCIHLGESGKNINTDIGNLVKKGLPVKMQKALDSVRVIGNNAVHPGVIDLKDDKETARKLFAFVNIIADVLITQPNEIEKFYEEKVPEKMKEAINKRDGK